jgi:hypothetical protein
MKIRRQVESSSLVLILPDWARAGKIGTLSERQPNVNPCNDAIDFATVSV